MNLEDIRRMIQPCTPDIVSWAAQGQARALWFDGNGEMQAVILCHTPGVTVIKGPGTPAWLEDYPNAVFVDFAIDPYAANGEGRDWIAHDTY